MSLLPTVFLILELEDWVARPALLGVGRSKSEADHLILAYKRRYPETFVYFREMPTDVLWAERQRRLEPPRGMSP